MHALLNVAKSSIPFTRPHLKDYKPKKAGWNVYVKHIFVESLRRKKIWKEGGQPLTVFIYNMWQGSRREYHKRRKSVMKRQNAMRKQRVAASFLVSNKKSFWKEISNIRGRTTRIALSIDGYSTNSEIANVSH